MPARPIAAHAPSRTDPLRTTCAAALRSGTPAGYPRAAAFSSDARSAHCRQYARPPPASSGTAAPAASTSPRAGRTARVIPRSSAARGRPNLVGQPAARPVVPPRPDLVEKLRQQTQPKAAPGQPAPRAPMPGRPASSPVPGQPIYRGPIRPGQPVMRGPGMPAPGGLGGRPHARTPDASHGAAAAPGSHR
jgi:translation initiation factor IF-2